jgi:hypothetical protein
MNSGYEKSLSAYLFSIIIPAKTMWFCGFYFLFMEIIAHPSTPLRVTA